MIEIIKSRRTIHLYEDRPVSTEIIQEAVEAAHYAPNHKLTWPWRFRLIGPETKAKLNEMAIRLKAGTQPLEGALLEKFQKKIIFPQVIVVSQVKSNDPFQSKEDYAAVSCAIQNFSLALAAHNIGSKWSTSSMIQHAKAYELAQIDSTLEEIVGFIWFGHPARTPNPKRPPIENIFTKLP